MASELQIQRDLQSCRSTGGPQTCELRGLRSYVDIPLLLGSFSSRSTTPADTQYFSHSLSIALKGSICFPYFSRRTNLISSPTLIPITSPLLGYCKSISICSYIPLLITFFMLCYIELLKKYLEVILSWYITISSLEILLSPLKDLILFTATQIQTLMPKRV